MRNLMKHETAQVSGGMNGILSGIYNPHIGQTEEELRKALEWQQQMGHQPTGPGDPFYTTLPTQG